MVRRQTKAALSVASSNEQQSSNVSLHDEVKQSLLNILRDETANPSAKASAARTLLEYFDDTKHHTSSNARGAELSVAELDAMIAQLRD
jgi:isocitrate/isopropylmalate dehydrogenase